MQDPEIQNILTDPVMRQVLFDLLIVILFISSLVTRVHVGFLIVILTRLPGVDRLPGEPQGCTGSPQEPSGDAQDTKTCDCRDCANEVEGEVVCV